MDYKDYFEQSKRRLEGTIDRLRKKNESIISSYGLGFDDSKVDTDSDRGVILTDVSSLANEYCCQISEVKAILQSYIDDSLKSGFHWYLLDLSEQYSGTVLSWEEIVDALSSFNKEHSICSTSNPVPLFIIGNDEIVPMPQIENPSPQVVGGEYLDVDYRYAFDSAGDEYDYSPFELEPSYYVGRAPFPAADDRSIDELRRYLEKCVSVCNDGGIEILSTSMVSTESWIPSSTDMVEDIPVSKVNSETGISVEGKLILSPNLDMEEDDVYQEFSEIENNADYLVFNLHGSDIPDSPSYYGEDINHVFHPEGFCIELLEENAPQILITTACFGARFINYDCRESMLLSAFSNGTLLFCGSCVVALGNPEGAGYSEYLLKLLNVYLHQGLPAGVAMTKAKRDYYRDKSFEEDDVFRLFTILEFNLFGNPIMYMKPKLAEDYIPKGMNLNREGRFSVPTFKEYKKRYLVKNNPASKQDILSQLRSDIDSGFERITRSLKEQLYDRLGIQDVELESIIENGATGQDRGYYYTFNKSGYKFDSRTIVSTDLSGNIKGVIQTK